MQRTRIYKDQPETFEKWFFIVPNNPAGLFLCLDGAKVYIHQVMRQQDISHTLMGLRNVYPCRESRTGINATNEVNSLSVGGAASGTYEVGAMTDGCQLSTHETQVEEFLVRNGLTKYLSFHGRKPFLRFTLLYGQIARKRSHFETLFSFFILIGIIVL